MGIDRFIYLLSHRLIAVIGAFLSGLRFFGKPISLKEKPSAKLGLAAGFDKEASGLWLWNFFGLGFVEIGTITRFAQKPLDDWGVRRLPDGKHLWNRLGFPSGGVDLVAARIGQYRKRGGELFLLASLGPNRDRLGNQEVYEDLSFMMKKLEKLVQLFVVNLSSPNTTGLRDLLKAGFLNSLPGDRKKTLIKLSPDMDRDIFFDVLRIIKEEGFRGVILSNTTLDRTGLPLQTPAVGGVSGQMLRDKNLERVAVMREFLGEDALIIGCGGVFTKEDVQLYRKAGADYVQAYTGFVMRPALFLEAKNIQN